MNPTPAFNVKNPVVKSWLKIDNSTFDIDFFVFVYKTNGVFPPQFNHRFATSQITANQAVQKGSKIER